MSKSVEPTRVIYDFGANNGDDIPYYLQKADKVVAVEANPILAQLIRERFAIAIKERRLIVENVVVAESDLLGPIAFYIDRERHWRSSVFEPRAEEANKHDKVLVKSTSAVSLIQKHGPPLYIKIDLEGLDIAILRVLFTNEIFPHYISAEGHDPAVLGMLSGFGQYRKFKIIRGPTIGRKIADVQITKLDGSPARHHFPIHSAGPFGEDIEGPWFNAKQLFEVLRIEGLGWYDIHAGFGPEPPDIFRPVKFLKSLRWFVSLTLPRVNTVWIILSGRLRSLGTCLTLGDKDGPGK